MGSEEERLAEFWADAVIPEGYYALEHVVGCEHAPEDPCGLIGTRQDWEQQLQLILSEEGGRIVGGPRTRDRHKVYWVALPTLEELNISLHSDGYWVASYALEMSVEQEEGVPSTIRIVHEGASKNKNTAIRRLVALVDAVNCDSEASPTTIVVVPTGGFWPMPPGTIPYDTIFPQ